MIDLETLMVDGFGLTTASPLQRATWRVIDGRPLGELADHPDVRTAIGDVSSLPVGVRPTEVVLVAGVRTAKSMMAAGAALRAALSVDVSKLGPGEIPRVSIVSLSRDLGAVTFNHLIGQIQARPLLRRLLAGDPKESSITIRHPSGHPVEISVVAASRAGGSLVARWSAGVIFDEAPRMAGEIDGAIVNLDDMIAAIEGRLLPGAQILAIGSPWAPWGPVYDRVTKHWGHPSCDIVVVRGTGPQMNPTWWSPERCEALLRKNPRAYRTDVLAEFAAPESSTFDPDDVAACFRTSPLGVEKGEPVLILDPSSGRGDAFVFAVARWAFRLRADAVVTWTMYSESQGAWGLSHQLPAGVHPESRFATPIGWRWIRSRVNRAEVDPAAAVVLVEEIGAVEGKFDLSAQDRVWSAIAAMARRHGVRRAYGDQRDMLATHAALRARGIRYEPIAWNAENKRVAAETLRRWMASRQLVLPDNPTLRRQLLEFRTKVTATGETLAGRGKHDDHAATLLTLAMAEGEGYLGESPIASKDAPRGTVTNWPAP